jgi:hypothetical protein
MSTRLSALHCRSAGSSSRRLGLAASPFSADGSDCGRRHRCAGRQQRPCLRDAFLPPAIAQQAVVPDFDKALRQDVQAKPPQELVEPQVMTLRCEPAA